MNTIFVFTSIELSNWEQNRRLNSPYSVLLWVNKIKTKGKGVNVLAY